MDYFNGINLFTICTWKGYLSDVKKKETKEREKNHSPNDNNDNKYEGLEENMILKIGFITVDRSLVEQVG